MVPVDRDRARHLPTCLVVYESMFGNTKDIALAVADGLSADFDVRTVPVAGAPHRLHDVALLVVGAPTHALGLSRPGTRTEAVAKGAEPGADVGPGVREWLDQLERPSTPIAAAVFDTRVKRPRPPGSAAKAARRRLHHLGLDVTAKPVTFSVDGTSGPLLAGEVDRARAWGRTLATSMPPSGRPLDRATT